MMRINNSLALFREHARQVLLCLSCYIDMPYIFEIFLKIARLAGNQGGLQQFLSQGADDLLHIVITTS